MQMEMKKIAQDAIFFIISPEYEIPFPFVFLDGEN